MAWTARKRKSVQGYMGALATPWPGTGDVGWRGAAAWLFASDSTPTPPTPPTGGLNWGSDLNASVSGLNIGSSLNIGNGLTLLVALLFGGLYARS